MMKLKELNPFNNVESDNKIIYIIKILLKTLITYFIGLEIAGIVVMIIASLFGIDPSFENISFNVMLLFKYYGYMVIILLFLLLVKKFSKMELSEIGLDKNIQTFIRGILYGFLTLISIVIVLMLLNVVKFGGINKNLNLLEFILFIGAWLVQASLEEIICRGYLFHKLKSKISIVVAILLNFSFFFIGHVFELFNDGIFLGLIGCLNLLLPTIIWSIMVLKQKNIYGAIGFHFIWNFSLFNIIGLNVSGIENTNSIFNFTSNNGILSGASYGIESSFITSLVLILVLVIIYKKK